MSWAIFKTAFLHSIACIEEQYFVIPRYGNNGITYVQRERVYCYELYHQLRCHLGDQFSYTVHGEIDKGGQQWIREQLTHYDPALQRTPNPDFVIHQPGNIAVGTQLVAIEVKPTKRLNLEKAQKDIRKLRAFVEAIGYQHAIFLIFGPDRPRLRINDLANDLEIHSEYIHVVWHQRAGEEPHILRRNGTW